MKKIARRKKERGRKKYLWALLVMLCFCLMMTVCPAMPGAAVVYAAGDGTSGNPWNCGPNGSNSVTATLSADGTLTISGSGAMQDYTGSTAKPWSNSKDSITSVVIKEGVTSIGESAFSHYGNLTNITIPSSVTSIGANAFYECSALTSIEIPEGVTSIGINAFYKCSNLTGKVTIPKGVESIGRYAFYQCSSLTDVEIVVGVTSIEDYAFSGCSSLTGITIPEGVTSIGTGAFSGCNNLTSITIPSSVTSIGTALFGNCSSLTSIKVEKENGTYDSRNDCNAIIEKQNDKLVTGCNVTTIPNSVKSIGDSAFSYCKNLTGITIPSGVTSIGNSAFYECSSLTGITIPSGVISIGNNAFSYCKNLTGITIPEGVESIGNSAFSSCWNLGGITIPSSVISIGANPFSGCNNLTSIVVEAGNEIYNSNNSCNAIIQTEGNILVAGCKKTVIPSGVTSIGNSAFNACGLTSIEIPEGVESIGNNAFYKCTSLTGITIPSSVTSIGNWAFYNCSNLANVTISEGVDSIGDWAFFQCGKLTGITIPSTVTSIGASAFRDCGLTGKVTIPNKVTSMGASVFYECTRLTSANIQGSVTKLENGVFGKCTSLTEVTIGSGVKIIDQFAFNGCSGLTSITIPESVTSIEYSAFKDCGLTSVIFEGTTTIPTVRNDSFKGCPAIATDAQGNHTKGIHIPSCEYLSEYLAKTGWWNYKNNINVKQHSGYSYAVDAANAATIQQSCACGSEKYGTAYLFLISEPNLIYNGSAITPVQVNCLGTWQGTIPNDGDITYENNTNAGTDTATASLTISGATASLKFSIAAKPLAESMISVADGPHYYTGSAVEPNVTVTDGDKTLTEKTDYTVDYDENINVGDSAKVTITGTGNYTGTASKAFTINKANSTVTTTPAAKNLTYNNSGQALISAGSASGGTMNYAVGTNSTTAPSSGWNTTVPKGTDAGTYYVWYKSVGDSNHSDSTPQCITVTIARADIEPTVSMSGWTFGGTAQEPSVEGNLGNGSVTYSYKVKGKDDSTYTTTKPSSAGTYTVKATIPETTNYNSGTAIADFTIRTATPTYTTPENLTATYGQTLADVTLPNGWTWKNSSTSVGNVGTHTFKATYTPSDTANYSTVDVDVTVTINKKSLTITADNQSIMQGTPIDQTKYKVSENGLITGDSISGITLTASTEDLTENGTISISGVIKIVNASGDVTDNYKIKTVDGKLEVTCNTAPAPETIVAAKAKTSYTVGDTLNVDDITVTASYADGYSKEVTGFTTNVADIDMSEAGEKTLTVSYTKNNVTKTADITITVYEQPVIEDGKGWSYVVTPDGGVKIVGYSGSDTAVEVPSEIGGKPVTAIDENAFADNTEITSVTIPDGVTEIGDGAFSGCTGLTTITIPDSVTTIGKDAFSGCTGLTTIMIPDSVTTIGKDAFSGCTGLTTITIPDSVTTIGKDAFSGCTGLTTIMIPEGLDTTKAGITGTAAKITYKVENGKIMITSVTPGTDGDGKEKPVTLPDTIGGKKPEIPDAVKEEMKDILHEHRGGTATCTKKAVCEICCEIYGGFAGHTLAKTEGVEATCTEDGRIDYWTCSECGKIFSDENGTAEITEEEVKLAALGHDWSGNWVVAQEPTATEDGVEETACTRGCGEKMLRTIPAAGDGKGWSYVVTPDGGVKIVGYSGSDTAVEVPSEIGGKPVTAIDENAFADNTEITSVTIPDGVTAIGDGAFSGCTGLTTITIPDSVTAIGDGAFSGCTGLTTITIPDSVTTIGKDAFSDCTGLTTIMIPEGLDTTKAGITGTAAKTTYKVENGKIMITSVIPGRDRDGKEKPVTLPDTIGGKKPEIPDAVKEEMKDIPHEHRGGTATCTKKAVCEICGGMYGDFAGHTLARTKGVEATCTEDGRIDYWTCSECGKIFSDENGTAEITAEEVKLAASGHNWFGDWDVKDEPSATEDGVKETACTRGCGEKMLRTIPAAGDGEVCSGVITSDGVEIVDCFGSDKVVEVPSEIGGRPVTAIRKDAFDGYTEITGVTIPVSVAVIGDGAFADCTRLTTIMIPDGLNISGAGITGTAAKITYKVENGKIVITSATPGTDRDGKEKPVTLPDTIGGKKPEIPDAVKEEMKDIPHEHRGGTATCTKKAACEICYGIYGGFAGHTPARTEGVEATCTEDGRIDYWTCSECGKIFSDENGTAEITAEEVKLAALAHDWSGGWDVKDEPDETEDGVEETACTHGCGAKMLRTIPVAGDGEVWSGVITSDGVEIVDCSGSDKVVEVPSEIGGRPVTAIRKEAFAGHTEKTSVTIPVSVTSVGENAFADCTGLTTIMILEGLDTTKAGITGTAAKITYKAENGKIMITSVIPGRDRDGKEKPVTLPDTIGGLKPEIFETVKEEMKDIPHEHRGGTATCTKKAACEICGGIYGDFAEHTFPEQWKVEKEATEKEPGREIKICEKCGAKLYRITDPLGTPADPNAGNIEKEIEVLSGAPDTMLNNSKEELAESVLTPEEIAEVDSGTNAKIWLKISPDVKIAEEAKVQIQKAAEESVGAGTEITYFDISLFKQVASEEKKVIHEPGRAVSVTIVIPEKLRNKDTRMVRNYQIIRLHGEKTDIIDGTYKEESAEFTFETDKFSVYAICYKDIPKQAEPTEPETPTPTPGGTTEPETPKPTPEMSSKEEQTKNELTLNAKIKVRQPGRKIKVSWGRISSADGYDVYVQYCGKKFTKKSITTIKSGKTTKATVKKVNGKPLNRKENYKIYVLAYKLADGKKIILGKSMIAHIVGRMNTKYTNVKAVKVKKSSYRLKKGKTAQIKAKTVLVSPGKKQISNAHAKQFRYAATNKKVATVSKKGKIKAVGKGNCTIYVYARNGYAKKIKVTVK